MQLADETQSDRVDAPLIADDIEKLRLERERLRKECDDMDKEIRAMNLEYSEMRNRSEAADEAYRKAVYKKFQL